MDNTGLTICGRKYMGPRCTCFFFQAEDGIRDRSPSRGLGDVYKRQTRSDVLADALQGAINDGTFNPFGTALTGESPNDPAVICLLYTSDAATIYSV